MERAKTHGFSFGFSVRHERFPAVPFLMHGGIHREKNLQRYYIFLKDANFIEKKATIYEVL